MLIHCLKLETLPLIVSEEHVADNFSQSVGRVIADLVKNVPILLILTTQTQESCTNVVDLLIGKEYFTTTMKKEPHREGRYFQTD